MIELKNVSFSYSRNKEALSDLSISVAQGETIGLVGANGSGKSTLLSMLVGLYAPTSGELSIDGLVSPGNEADIQSRCRLVMQDADLQIVGATVEEDLLLGREKLPEAMGNARSMAEGFGLTGHWKSPVHTLSWGMKKKVCLAAALLDAPKVLLLDEPFSGLDYPGIREMRRMIVANAENSLTQVVAAHDLECLVDLVDRIAVLHDGRLAVFGTPEQVLCSVREYGVRPPCSWQIENKVRPWDD